MTTSMGELSAKLTEGVKSHQTKTPSVTTSSCHLPQEGGHEYSAPKTIFIRFSWCDVGIAPYGKSRKVMSYRGMKQHKR